jgi:hypothetical protein
MRNPAFYLLGLLLCHAPLLYAQDTLSQNMLHFDGNDDYVTLNSLAGPIASATNFTVEFWLKTDYQKNTSSPRVNIFTINPNSAGENKFAIVLGNNSTAQTGQLSIYEAGEWNGGHNNSAYLTTEDVVGDNSCHHIAYVRTGNMGEAFIDGVSFGTIAVKVAASSDDRISLGQEWDQLNPSDFFNGAIDELRIWNTARSETELKDNMNKKMVGNETGLIAYYNFNQGAAGGDNPFETTLNDLTSNNYDGTLNNFGLTGSTSNWITQSCARVTAIDEPASNPVLSVFPNPFNISTTIRLNKAVENAELSIYNLQGQLVRTRSQITGDQISIERENLSSGLYFFELKQGKESVTGKIVIID